jgi:UDP-glucose 4-epimerase
VALYLVTGASGFIGNALCTHIRQHGHRVRALLHTEANGPWDEAISWDLCRSPLPEQLLTGVDGMFHCAGAAHFKGLSQQQQNALWQLNVDATGELLARAASAGVKRLVYFSSVQAAGKPGDSCASESWQAVPDNLYGESKLAAEGLVHAIARKHPMHTCILRPTLVYGPGVKGNLARMLRAIARGRMPPLPDSGNRRSMVALNNLVAAAWLAMERDDANRRTFIVCDATAYSTRQIYEAIHRALGRPLPRFTLPLSLFRLAGHVGDLGNKLSDNAMPWDSAAYERLFGNACYSAARLEGELGWQPGCNFEQLLPAMIKSQHET